MAIDYIGFDCGNVLIRFDTERFYSFIRRKRRNCLEPQEIFTGSKKQIVIDYDLGKLTDEEFFQSVQEAFQLDEVPLESFFYLMGITITPDYAMLSLRDEFRRRGVGTVLVSNMNPFHLRYLELTYPEVLSGFDYRMISCEEGIDKPNQEAWIRPLDFLGIKAEQLIYIDDVMENIFVACELGIKGWYYNVKDNNLLFPEKLKEESQKFREFLELLWNKGILKSHT